MTPRDDPARPWEADAERALADALRVDATEAACPPAEILAGWAEGGLPEEARAAVEEHLAACAACRAIAVDLRTDGDLGRPDAPAPPPASPGPATIPRAASSLALGLVLAAIALALGAWWWLARGEERAAPAPPAPTTFEEQFRAAARLVKDDAVLAGFEPLDRSTLAAARAEAQRGGIAVVAPRGTVLSQRPRFRWLGGERPLTYTLALVGEDGKEAWSRTVTGEAAEFPADAPALPRNSTWVWSVRARRATGPVEGSVGFQVASGLDAAAYEQAVHVVRGKAPPAVADLLVAHVALRAGLLEEAEAVLEASARRGPRPELERLTREYVRARLGLERGP